MEYIQK